MSTFKDYLASGIAPGATPEHQKRVAAVFIIASVGLAICVPLLCFIAYLLFTSIM